MRKVTEYLVLAGLALLLSACQPSQKAEAPKPQLPPSDAIGYFCNMLVAEHTGPKSQIHLTGKAEPLWFTSVRDGIAFTMLPEESQAVTALYVSAIDATTEFNLEHPELFEETWVDATWAFYVIDSSKRGGMGAAEAFPFKDPKHAEQFAEQYGGRMVTLAEIPKDYILGNTATMPMEEYKMQLDSPDHDEMHREHER